MTDKDARFSVLLGPRLSATAYGLPMELLGPQAFSRTASQAWWTKGQWSPLSRFRKMGLDYRSAPA